MGHQTARPVDAIVSQVNQKSDADFGDVAKRLEQYHAHHPATFARELDRINTSFHANPVLAKSFPDLKIVGAKGEDLTFSDGHGHIISADSRNIKRSTSQTDELKPQDLGRAGQAMFRADGSGQYTVPERKAGQPTLHGWDIAREVLKSQAGQDGAKPTDNQIANYLLEAKHLNPKVNFNNLTPGEKINLPATVRAGSDTTFGDARKTTAGKDDVSLPGAPAPAVVPAKRDLAEPRLAEPRRPDLTHKDAVEPAPAVLPPRRPHRPEHVDRKAAPPEPAPLPLADPRKIRAGAAEAAPLAYAPAEVPLEKRTIFNFTVPGRDIPTGTGRAGERVTDPKVEAQVPGAIYVGQSGTIDVRSPGGGWESKRDQPYWLSASAGRAFLAARAELASRGIDLRIDGRNGAGRLHETEQNIRTRGQISAPSGRISNHEVGNAFDAAGDWNNPVTMAVLRKYGFRQGDSHGPIRGDAHHFSYAGGTFDPTYVRHVRRREKWS